MKNICVFGSYQDLGEAAKNDFQRLGMLLAQRECTIVSGGFGGTMEDVSRGARQADGHTIGVTYYKFTGLTKKHPNPYIVEEREAKDLFERVSWMLELADAFIVLPGGTGTLLELSAVLEFINKGLMIPKPVIAIGDFWRPVIELLTHESFLQKNTDPAKQFKVCSDLVTFVSGVDEVVDVLFSRKAHRA